MTTAYISVFEGGKQIDTLYPAKWAFRQHENEPTTEVAIRRTFAEDLYVVMPSNDPATVASQVAPLEIVINPLVNWIWLGFGVLAFGTGIALLPERVYSFALAKMPAEAAGGSLDGRDAARRALIARPTVCRRRPGCRRRRASTRRPRTTRAPTSRSRCSTKSSAPAAAATANIAECRKDPCRTSHQMRRRAGGADRSGQVARRDHRSPSSQTTATKRCSARR